MLKTTTRTIAIATILSLSVIPAMAGKADVQAATARKTGNSWQISATIKHGDEGWKHYANSFQVLTMEGKVLGTRVLYHPHVDEQPFTRSVANVQVPVGVTEIIIRAHDSKHGDGERIFKLKLPKRK